MRRNDLFRGRCASPPSAVRPGLRSGVRSGKRALIGASLVALAGAIPLAPALAQPASCPEPGGTKAARSGIPAAMRVYDQDPAFAEIARADLLAKQGRRGEAAAIYRRYVALPPDHRQTARRAQLRLAQVEINNKNFTAAENLVAQATGEGATPDLVARGRQMNTLIAWRRASAAAEQDLEALNPLIAAKRYDDALQAGRILLQRACPYPVDFPARVKARIAQIYRATDNFPAAKAMAVNARDSATTSKIRSGTVKLIAEINAAAFAAGLRAQIGQANALAAADNRNGAIAILRPLVARSDIPADIATQARLRLAHAYRANDDFPAARTMALAAQARATTAETRQSASALLAEIDAAALAASLRAEIDRANGLIEANNPTGAIAILQPVADRPDAPPQIANRARLRLAHALALSGRYDEATGLARQMLASGALDAEGRAQALGVEMSAQIAKANAFLTAGQPGDAIAVLEPVVARTDLPPQVGITARLRLARAYAQAARYDDARNLLEPLRAGGALDGPAYGAASHIYLARAAAMQAKGDYAGADPAYRELLAWNPPIEGAVRDNARLGLARSLDRMGQRRAAREQVLLVRADPADPELRARAVALLADIDGDIPPDRLVGHIEVGTGYDSNVPTLVTAQDTTDDTLGFPANQKFGDAHIEVSGQLQYRKTLGGGDSTLDFSLAALRTFQFDLTQLDRTRIEASAGPAIAIGGGGSTRVLLGVTGSIEWRGGHFRSSEPGLYAGIRTDLGNRLSLTAVYTLGFHNDYRDERDGTDHQFDALFRYDPSDADVVHFDLRATREGGHVAQFRNWRGLAGADWTHRWHSGERVVPFVTLAGSAERVVFDGQTTAGIARRDWKLNAEAEAGVEIDRRWRASVHYAFHDINSNVPDRNRRPDHQVGLALRYLWN